MAFRAMRIGLIRMGYLNSPPLLRGKSMAQKFVAVVGNRNMSQEIPISRFPVPNIDTLPKDIQERMKEVEEKVGKVTKVPCSCRDKNAVNEKFKPNMAEEHGAFLDKRKLWRNNGLALGHYDFYFRIVRCG